MGRNRKRSIGSVLYSLPQLSGEEVTKQLGDWSTYPRGARQMFDDGIQTLTAYLESDSAINEYFRDSLGLDPDNEEHVEVAAALMGITSGYQISYDEDEQTFATQGEDSSGYVKIFPSSDGTVSVDINTFAKLRSSRQSNLAYSMIRRMVWGMRRYAELNNVPPSGSIYLQAESDGVAMNGVETWAKLGFNFGLRTTRDAARELGFEGKNSQEILMERNAAGQLGFDAWNDIVQQTINDKGSAEEDGGFNVSDDSMSILILNAYAARRGF